MREGERVEGRGWILSLQLSHEPGYHIRPRARRSDSHTLSHDPGEKKDVAWKTDLGIANPGFRDKGCLPAPEILVLQPCGKKSRTLHRAFEVTCCLSLRSRIQAASQKPEHFIMRCLARASFTRPGPINIITMIIIIVVVVAAIVVVVEVVAIVVVVVSSSSKY